MKRGLKGEMNIDFNERYDEESDIYYVTFKSGEPSFAKEVDDVLLLEVGAFTGLPTGFRLLNYSKHKVTQVEIKRVREVIGAARKQVPQMLDKRSKQIETALERALA
jgi:uncharacterized protein YuzE